MHDLELGKLDVKKQDNKDITDLVNNEDEEKSDGLGDDAQTEEEQIYESVN